MELIAFIAFVSLVVGLLVWALKRPAARSTYRAPVRVIGKHSHGQHRA